MHVTGLFIATCKALSCPGHEKQIIYTMSRACRRKETCYQDLGLLSRLGTPAIDTR